MKNSILSSIALLMFTTCIFSQQSDSQNKNLSYRNSLKVSPINLALGEFGITYERVLTKDITLSIYSDIEFADIKFLGEKIGNGYEFVIGVDLRYYFSKNKTAPRGWYAGAGFFTDFVHVEIAFDQPAEKQKSDVTGIGARSFIGYQWIFKNGINLGVDGGVKYTTVISKEIDFSEFNPQIGFTVGYSW